MKRIGIFGGTSPESTAEYYRRITRQYVERFGDHGYPEILIHSVSFQQYIDWMQSGDWQALAEGIRQGFSILAAGGAEIGLLATNTFHRVFDEVAASSPVPLISLLDVVADQLTRLGSPRTALLGTRFTMSSSFYPDRLARNGIEVLVPEDADQDLVHRIIFDELSRGVVSETSKAEAHRIVEGLADRGANSVILGCTELPLLIGPDDLSVPSLNTTHLHADAILDAALDSANLS